MTIKSPATFNSTDLVLQLAGGARNGQLLPVSTAKCLLSSLIVDKAEAEKYRCAIFRGEKGVAFRIYGELVLANGNKTSVQWLKEGDTIQLTPEVQVVVKHLGTFVPTNAPDATKAPIAAPRQVDNTISMAPATDHGKPATSKIVNEASAESKPAGTPATKGTQVEPTAEHQVGLRMNVLSDQLTSLVDAASDSGAVPAAAGLNNQSTPPPAGEPLSDKKMADTSSSIQNYLDKALGSNNPTASSANPMPQTPVVAPAQPADFAMGTPEPSRTQAPLEISATAAATPVSPSSEQATKQREDAVANSLNRLLAGTDVGPVVQAPVAQSSTVTAEDQPSGNSNLNLALKQSPTLPIASKASEVLASDSASPMAPPVAPSPIAGQPPVCESVETDAPVDTPKAQSMELLKSLGIDAEELGLGNATPTSENTAHTLENTAHTSENTAFAALPTADEIIASVSMSSALPTEEEAPEPVAAPKKAESVADVLARMQNVGSLENFTMDGPAEEASPEALNVPAEVATPKPQISETVVAEASTESQLGADEDGSVENYMSQLLTRMRGGEESNVLEDQEPEAVKPAPPKEPSAETDIVKSSVEEFAQQTLTAEQFVPKEKAVRMKSFDSLREIANNSNRSAIQDHLANQRQIATQTKMQLSLISLAFGVLFFLMSWVFSSEVNAGGVICGILFLISGVVFAKFCRDEQQLDASITKAQNAKG